MSHPYRDHTRYRQHPYKHWTGSSAVKQEKVYEDVKFSSSPFTHLSESGGNSRLPAGWDYLLRRKAEKINDRILKSKASASCGGTSYDKSYEVSSQFVIKQGPDSPAPREQYRSSALSWTTCNDPSQDYAHKGGFWIGRKEERNSLDLEAGQSSSNRLANAHENQQTHKVEIEHSLRIPDHESRHSNYPVTSAGQGGHLTIEKLISNIRSAVASNPNFNRNGVDSVCSHTSNNPAPREQYCSSALSWTSCNDLSQEYAQKEGFWIGRKEERNSLDLEAGQSSYDQPANAYENQQMYKVKSEHPLQIPDHQSHHSYYPVTSTGQGSHLMVEKLMSNIRSTVASNPNFKRNGVDSICSPTSENSEKQSSISDTSFGTTSSGLGNPVTHVSEEISNSHLLYNTGNEVRQGTMMDRTSDIPHGSGNIHHHSKQDTRRNQYFPGDWKTLTHTLPYPAEGVEVQYTEDPIEAEAWLKKNVIDCSAQAVGLDIEWKPQHKRKKDGGIENKTAVLQLSVEESCLVLHLCHMKSKPKLLRKVLRNKMILKVGSGILQDVTKLHRDTGLRCKGLMDTQKMAKSIGIPVSQKLGLKALAKHFLGFDMEKPKSVSMSNWERRPLTVKQIHYAALDAWIGLKIYLHMKIVKGQEQVFSEDDNEEQVETLQCEVCGKKVKGQDALNNHSRIHPQCKCGQVFMAKISENHQKKCPFSNTLAQEGQTADEATVWCQGCGKKCKNEEVFLKHVREVGHVQCPFCNRLLQNAQSTKHIRRCRNKY